MARRLKGCDIADSVASVTGRRILTAVGLVAMLVALAVPVLAVKPTSPPGQANRPDKPDMAAISISGAIQQSTDAHGRPVFTVHDGGITYILEGGPSWFYADEHPLSQYVGQVVTVAGKTAEGSGEIDLDTVDGTPLREPGRPPWAGGWRVVGEQHPGWSHGKADRHEADRHEADRHEADCWPPGHCKRGAHNEPH